MTTPTDELTAERREFLKLLDRQRGFIRHTAAGLTEEQARSAPTASALCVGGLIKHVTEMERGWARFIEGGAEAMQGAAGSTDGSDWNSRFQLADGETLAATLAEYAEVAAHTDELVRTTDLEHSHPLPVAPWFEPGASWSARMVLLHLVAEISQHAGHADIIRETIDGQKTMG
jgi:hypothetical protein